MSPKNDHYIIIKRSKKVHGGHHGGNWKVAYADFMTALMAFFLLLWILSGADEEQLRGLADYFTPSTVPLVDINGLGTEIEARKVPEATPVPEADAEPVGPADEGQKHANETEDRPGAINPWLELDKESQIEQEGQTLSARLDSAEQQLSEMLNGSPELEVLAEQVLIERTEHGLQLEVIDLGDRPMFEVGSALVSDDLLAILDEVAPIMAEIPMSITITGHTDARPYRDGADYGNWELSSDRANATRRALIAAGIPQDRFISVSGVAAVSPLIAEDVNDARNRRVTIEFIAQEG